MSVRVVLGRRFLRCSYLCSVFCCEFGVVCEFVVCVVVGWLFVFRLVYECVNYCLCM